MIKTGKGTITLVALLGIWSVSALTSLPGLAVSPILDKIQHIFPHSSEFDVQMLTSLPSLLIIPFMLFSGRMAERLGYYRVLACGLWLFLLSGVLYMICTQMWQLILVSALLGIGSGIIIPLSTSLISRFFYGDYRTRQFGYSSAITNVTLVLATALTGYLAEVEWRLPFVVYLFPVVSIFLLPFVWRSDNNGVSPVEKREQSSAGINYKSLSLYMLYYFVITYLTVIVSFNLSFLMNGYGYDSGTSGVVISIFFLAIMVPGLFLSSILKIMKGKVELRSLLVITIGLFVIYTYSSLPLIILGCIITGVGYGIAQPYLYDKVTQITPTGKVTYALALLMVMNYVAILVCPFIVDYMQDIVHDHSQRFAFGFNFIIAILSLLVMIIGRIVLVYKKK